MSERIAKSYDEMHPGRFLTAGLLGGKQRTLTISAVIVTELEREEGEEKTLETAGIVRFRETQREWVLNITNSRCMIAMWGTDPQAAVGHRITLYPTSTKLGKLDVDAIRVWGSPELDKDVVIEVALPRKRPLKVTLHAVRGKALDPTVAQPEPGAAG
jgi:hypothetical protein